MARSTDSNTTLSLTAASLSALYPESLSGEESLNALGLHILNGVVDGAPLTLASAVASHVTTTLHKDALLRPMDWLVAEIRQLPADATAERYQLLLRPWLWWLGLASNNRVFQNLATSDIVTTIFKAHGFTDFQLKLTGSYTPREYCVQYGETDLAFVSRLMEEDGIFWFFSHEDSKHTLVLADSNDAFAPIPNGPTVNYLGQKMGARELHGIRSGQVCLQAVAGVYQATDYEFTTPTTSLFSQAEAVAGPNSMYEHPGGYTAKAQGDALTKQRVDGLRSQEKRFVGESDCRWLVPGYWFTLAGHDDSTLNIDWVVTSVSHEGSHDSYRNRFEAIPKATAYRPARITPKPRMHTQTALVVGKAGEEIWTDEYGRIKLQFPWDRTGKNDETSSCWVRVVLPWSGKGFGMQFVPRIGQEVIVTFIDGDPDRPLVTGCVYNGDNALPYALPANQTQSGIKTNSSKGGGGFNELRFEDKKDAEEVFLQAQKDFNINVLNDTTATVGHDETLTVQNARTRTVKDGDETVTLEKGKRSVTIQTGSDSLDVKDTRTVTVGSDQNHSTGGNYAHKVSGNYDLTVDGNLTIKVSGTLTLQSGGSFAIKSGADLAAQASTSISQKAGTALSNQAGTSLENKAGTTLTNDAGISLVNKAAAEQTVDGGGMLTIKGGLVKVN
ncbi:MULTISPECIES: type VI secretion system tip protein VgrG [unclassified Pseudomonas]|uniref:type VI secretion system Vgr family protein n=1 Tax=unclassified Pseudomonas TaxID=196821 RepID=UPI000908B3F4|nr:MULTISPECIES: type VI secretion system tip protein VgrG [unclassified Pseudomonas]ROO36260.1 type IV secretion protein Rhs [Pseudomonas sp. AF76]SFW74957.1 type VI secretion system secreted protein VgrG [Pseudomonas sp. NFACC09-4]SFX80372.1 type VI secretion system secreted protein VgrG [Pseudomonas sp. NFACC47-1]SFY05583.1 type VI secretion system secreted protein VgrG [Pseudomonas sp. NFACC36]SFY31165.1 type VI secretion system secreted protein VgrG [Pseudomonas sp. NFACC43]